MRNYGCESWTGQQRGLDVAIKSILCTYLTGAVGKMNLLDGKR